MPQYKTDDTQPIKPLGGQAALDAADPRNAGIVDSYGPAAEPGPPRVFLTTAAGKKELCLVEVTLSVDPDGNVTVHKAELKTPPPPVRAFGVGRVVITV